MKNLIIISCVLWSFLAFANTVPEKGLTAFQNEDWETALQELIPIANDGHYDISLVIAVCLALLYVSFN